MHKMWKKNNVIVTLIFFITLEKSDAQLFKALGNLISPVFDVFNSKAPLLGSPPSDNNFGSRNTVCRNTIDGHTVCGFGSAGYQYDEGTLQPQATGFDEVFPANCGRNIKDGTGKLCFPDGILCEQRK